MGSKCCEVADLSAGFITRKNWGLVSSRRGPRPYQSLVVSLMLVSMSLAHLQSIWTLFRLLGVLAMCHDPYSMNMQLGNIYADSGATNRAVECYIKAMPIDDRMLSIDHADALPEGQSRPPINSAYLHAWERLDKADPFNPNVHYGFGQMFFHYGKLYQADMEFEQASKLCEQHPFAQRVFDEVPAVFGGLTSAGRCSTSDNGEDYEKPYQQFEEMVEARWHPPDHDNFLVTRCRIFIWGSQLVSKELIGKSGLDSQDCSVMEALKLGEGWDLEPSRNTGVYSIACMSDRHNKLVSIISETSPTP